jgi:hypothetical protein
VIGFERNEKNLHGTRGCKKQKKSIPTKFKCTDGKSRQPSTQISRSSCKFHRKRKYTTDSDALFRSENNQNKAIVRKICKDAGKNTKSARAFAGNRKVYNKRSMVVILIIFKLIILQENARTYTMYKSRS